MSGSSWLGTQEDMDDFAEMSDEYLIMIQKKKKRSEDQEYLASSTMSTVEDEDHRGCKDDLGKEDDVDPAWGDHNDVRTTMTSPSNGQDDLNIKMTISTAVEQEDDSGEPEKVLDMKMSPPTTHKGVEVACVVPTAHTEAVCGYSLAGDDDPFVVGAHVDIDSGHRSYKVAIMGRDYVENTQLTELPDMVKNKNTLCVPKPTTPAPSTGQHSATSTGKLSIDNPNIFACLAVPTQRLLSVDSGDISPTQDNTQENLAELNQQEQVNKADITATSALMVCDRVKTDVKDPPSPNVLMSASKRAGTEQCQAQTDTAELGDDHVVGNVDTTVVVGTWTPLDTGNPPPSPRMMSDEQADPEAGTERCQTQTRKRGGGDEFGTVVDATSAGEARTPLVSSRGCQHDKRGHCASHGWGARRLERRVLRLYTLFFI